jgi:hypothetical protein
VTTTYKYGSKWFNSGLTAIEKILLWLLHVIWTKIKYLGLADGDNLYHGNLNNGQGPKQIFLITIIIIFSTRT